MRKLLNDEVFVIAFAIAKRCFNREKSLHSDRFPASGTDFSLKDDQNSWTLGFKNGRPLCKMAPRCVLGWIPRITGTGKLPPYGGFSLDSEVFHPLERINWVLMHFNGLFTFAWRWFLSTAILLERIILIKRGTTVLRKILPMGRGEIFWWARIQEHHRKEEGKGEGGK